jgi:predicted RNase H-like HicB family nuclease
MRNYTVLVFEAEADEGGYWASVAELPGCYSQGESLSEVEENLKDAAEEYLHALKTINAEPPPSVYRKLEVAID